MATVRKQVVVFNAEGTGGALATVATLATLSLVLPSFTTSRTGPEFSPGQLTFAALAWRRSGPPAGTACRPRLPVPGHQPLT